MGRALPIISAIRARIRCNKICKIILAFKWGSCVPVWFFVFLFLFLGLILVVLGHGFKSNFENILQVLSLSLEYLNVLFELKLIL